MVEKQDPVERASDGAMDLYDISTWEQRTSVDGLASALYWLFRASSRFLIIAVAFGLLVSIGGFAAITDLEIGLLTVLSAIPALGLAAYVYYSDITTGEPLVLLVGTFLLSVLTASFAAILNSYIGGYFEILGFAGTLLSFFLVVGPVEESMKLLAVRLFAYTDDRFNSVVDGAVYGAMAGLGFAFIENAIYITRELPMQNLDLGLELLGMGGSITAVRALAGPGHVIYSAIAGYYLGLAKFNRENRGPIIIKGLLIAAFIHAMYNVTVGFGTVAIDIFTPLSGLWASIAYVLIYDGFFGYFLIRKIRRYSRAYRQAHMPTYDEASMQSETTEIE
ncbi:PrsW family intramembrane metalloprotease [Halogeometricum borinquense]|uniref:PrsW family intramembrane metalloprotease n=1 Tax=Halogeometricum borinquense TaxID=60847 RepID=A0A6C0UH25_9EURY|nr:PrsW family intramembrane metalloprotease [Halogeometricum borinquense]QIB73099.1 PrsW family intramembrane metalloprotease [Halogeometricum borinquense]QIQ77503.1 PrsW family intramembrane metalloprotease [Halogeometricum borinquense]